MIASHLGESPPLCHISLRQNFTLHPFKHLGRKCQAVNPVSETNRSIRLSYWIFFPIWVHTDLCKWEYMHNAIGVLDTVWLKCVTHERKWMLEISPFSPSRLNHSLSHTICFLHSKKIKWKLMMLNGIFLKILILCNLDILSAHLNFGEKQS